MAPANAEASSSTTTCCYHTGGAGRITASITGCSRRPCQAAAGKQHKLHEHRPGRISCRGCTPGLLAARLGAARLACLKVNAWLLFKLCISDATTVRCCASGSVPTHASRPSTCHTQCRTVVYVHTPYATFALMLHSHSVMAPVPAQVEELRQAFICSSSNGTSMPWLPCVLMCRQAGLLGSTCTPAWLADQFEQVRSRKLVYDEGHATVACSIDMQQWHAAVACSSGMQCTSPTLANHAPCQGLEQRTPPAI